MAQVSFNLAAHNTYLTSSNGTVVSTSTYTFTMPPNLAITSMSISFSTTYQSGSFADKYMTINSNRSSGTNLSSGQSLPTSMLASQTNGGSNSYKFSHKTMSGQTASWGIGSVVLTVNYTPNATRCTAPTSVWVSADNVSPGATVTLNWSGAAGGTNNPITGYKVTRCADNSDPYNKVFYELGTSATTSLSVVAPTVEGAYYTYMVITVGTEAGFDSLTNNVSATLTCHYTAPPAPTGLTFAANNLAPSAATTLTWTASNGDNNAVVRYDVYRSTTSGGTFTLLAQPTAKSLAVSAPATNGATFYYKIYSIGTLLNSDISAESSALVCYFTNPSISNVQLNGSSSNVYSPVSGNLTLTWSAANGTNNAITSYHVYCNGGYIGTFYSGTLSVTVPASAGAHIYTVYALGTYSNSDGVNSPYALAYTPCIAPTSISVSSTNVAPDAAVTLSWSGASGGGLYNTVAGYFIFRSTNADGSYTHIHTTTDTSCVVNAPLTNGASFFYKVVTDGTQQDSVYSSAASSALTCSFSAPSAPTSVAVSSTYVASGNVTLSWSGASAGTNNPIVSYDVYKNGVLYGNTATSSMSVPSHETAGSNNAYTVITKGTYSDSVASSSAVVYTYSDTSAPTVIAVASTNVAPSASVLLSWSGAAAGTLNAITGYKVHRSATSGGTYTYLATVTTTATSGSLSVTAPSANGGTYFYKVSTVGVYSESAQSAASGDLTCTYTVPTVTNVQVNSSGSAIYVTSASSVTLSWTGNAGTNNAISSYTIYKDGVSIKTGQASSPFTVTASTNTSAVFAVVAIGVLSNSSSVNSPTVYGYNAVNAVASISVDTPIPEAGANIALSWSAPSAVNYNDIAGYTIYRSTDNVNFTSLATVTLLTYTTPAHSTMGSSYYYKIITEGSRLDSAYSPALTVTSKVYTNCGAPNSISWNTPATNLYPETSRTINWSGATAGTNNAIVGYKIYRSTDGTNYTLFDTVVSAATSGSLAVTSPATSSSYYFKIITYGTNLSFNSSYSGVVTISTLFTSPAVTDVKINASASSAYILKNTNATLTWTGTAGTNNPIVSYNILRDGVQFANTSALTYEVPAHATENSNYAYSVTPLGTFQNGSNVAAPILYSYSNVSAPTTVTVSGNNVAPNSNVTLNFSGAVGGGTYNAITGYSVYRSLSSASGYVLLGTVTTTATSGSLVITAHSSNNTYYYYKVATNGARTSSAQSTANASLQTVFTNPTVSTVTIDGSSSPVYVLAGVTGILSWSATNGTNNNVVSYDIYRNGIFWNNTLFTSFSVVADATAGNNYVYTIYPIGQFSTGSGVASAAFYSCSMPTLPTVFTATPAIPDVNTSFTLGWSGAVAGSHNAITGYEVYRSSSIDGTYTLLSSPTGASLSATSHVTMGTSYFYKIKTIAAHHSTALSTPLTVTSQTYTVPAAPATVSLSKVYTIIPNENVTLSWSVASAGTNNPVTSYDIYRSTTSGGTLSFVSNTASTSATVTSHATHGQKYYYRVVTKGTKTGFIDSVPSAEIMIETAPYTACTDPSVLLVSGVSTDVIIDATSASFTWTASSAGTNNPVTGYAVQERVYNNSNSLLYDWRNATNLSGVPAYTTATNSILVYPPEMGNYKKFRVKAVGTAAGFDSNYVELTSKVFRKIYTACGSPTVASVSNVVEQSLTLSWSAAVGGTNNNIAGYNIQYKESSDGGVTWGSWTDITTVNSSATSGSYTVSVSPTRGRHRIYRVRTQGAAGASWYSPYAESSAVKANLVPLAPTLNFPKNSTAVFGSTAYIGVTLPTEPEGHSQRIYYEVLQSSVVISSGYSSVYTTAGAKVFPISLGTFTNGALTLKIRSVDSLGGEAEFIQISLTGQTLSWTRSISAGMSVVNHIADINDLLSKVNSVRQTYGLAAITLVGTVGYFSNWYPQMVQMRNALTEIYQLVQITSPTWLTSTTGYPNAAIFNQIKTAVTNLG